MSRRLGGGSDLIYTVESLGDGEVHVPKGYRRKARLTVADPVFGHTPEAVHELLDVLGLLDDETVPER